MARHNLLLPLLPLLLLLQLLVLMHHVKHPPELVLLLAGPD
jgi:hypothetical protein